MSKYHILVVDDDAIFLMLTEKFLENIDFNQNVNTFSNGRKAYDYLKEHFNEDDHYIVLLDLNMPVMNGWQFLDKIDIDQYNRNVDVFIVTSSTDSADIEKSNNYKNVKSYISKPINHISLSEIKSMYVSS